MTHPGSSLTCASRRGSALSTALLTVLALSAPSGAQVPADEPPGWLASAAADRITERALGRSDRHGAIRLDDGTTVFLYGEAEEVELFLAGGPADFAV